MRRILIGLFVVGLVGCTLPTQPIAENSFKVYRDRTDEHINDLSNLVRQAATDAGVAAVREAAEKGDPDAAEKAFLTGVNTFDLVGNLRVEHEKANAYGGVAYQYIEEQKGLGNIAWDDVKEAFGDVGTNG